MNNEYYEIYIDDVLIDTTSLGGIAFLIFQSAQLISTNSKLIRRYQDEDNIIKVPQQYNIETGGWECLD